MKVNTPPLLKKGDILGIVAPAGKLRDCTQFEKGIEVLHSLGFKTKFPKKMWPGSDYLADTDQRRAREFVKMLENPKIKGVIAARGGFGSIRMLSQLERRNICFQPKPVVGFSDITILLLYLKKRFGMATVHGPVLTSLPQISPLSVQHLFQTLTGQTDNVLEPEGLQVIKEGKCKGGRLVGGNLSSLVSLLGTAYDIPYTGGILFLEDVNEPPYKIDKMLTQLELAGKFSGLRGIVLGDFTGENSTEERRKMESFVFRRILDIVKRFKYPVLGSFPVGHGVDNMCLYIGKKVVVDLKNPSLRYV